MPGAASDVVVNLPNAIATFSSTTACRWCSKSVRCFCNSSRMRLSASRSCACSRLDVEASSSSNRFCARRSCCTSSIVCGNVERTSSNHFRVSSIVCRTGDDESSPLLPAASASIRSLSSRNLPESYTYFTRSRFVFGDKVERKRTSAFRMPAVR